MNNIMWRSHGLSEGNKQGDLIDSNWVGLKAVESAATNCVVMEGLAQKSGRLDFYPTSATNQLVGFKQGTPVKWAAWLN